MLDHALEEAVRNGTDLYDAELHRLDGELKLHTPGAADDEPETALRRAIAIAREQHARLWEVRAALSLARMWRQQGSERDARALVADTCARFTEGFDTPDVSAARVFLGRSV